MSSKSSTIITFLPLLRGKVRMGVKVWRNVSTLTLALSLHGRGDLISAVKKDY
jgi:hypothetical protein